MELGQNKSGTTLYISYDEYDDDRYYAEVEQLGECMNYLCTSVVEMEKSMHTQTCRGGGRRDITAMHRGDHATFPKTDKSEPAVQKSSRQKDRFTYD